MSLVPLLENIARELDNDAYQRFWYDDHLLDDDFGFGIHPLDIFHRPRSMPVHLPPRRRLLPYDRAGHLMSKRRRESNNRESGGGGAGENSALMPHIGKDGFQVSMHVSQFKPNELTVKTVDNTVIVEGKHEEREDDHGLVQRHFVRKYTLPKGYDPQEVVSTISSDGVLTVKAPPPNKGESQKERIIQIQHTGPAHLSVKTPEPDKVATNGGSDEMDAANNKTGK